MKYHFQNSTVESKQDKGKERKKGQRVSNPNLKFSFIKKERGYKDRIYIKTEFIIYVKLALGTDPKLFGTLFQSFLPRGRTARCAWEYFPHDLLYNLPSRAREVAEAADGVALEFAGGGRFA
ncbi:hypothetical protein L1049_019727 [Liquidambar formosana]|uniref:Uncharacterized protein n=1 Tax=Liquidambar formosana TaxID=63359 RepID=A0AAP0S720_LIQFO